MSYRLPVSLTTFCAALTALHLLAVCGCAESKVPSPAEPVTQAGHFVHEVSHLKANTEFKPWKYIILHHSATTTGSVESIHKAHRQRRDSAGNPWRGIGYHFVVGNGNGMEDGEVQATFRWNDQSSGAHAGDRLHNNFGIGICLIGNFEQNGPTSAQVRSVSKLVAQLKFQFRMTAEQVLKHGDLKATACPGRLFPFQHIASIPPASRQLVKSKTRSRFSSGETVHMEGIQNVVSIRRFRSAQRAKSTDSVNSSGSK